MKNKPVTLFIILLFISVVCQLFIAYVIDLYKLSIPEIVPGVEISLFGLLVLGFYILVIVFYQKQLLKFNCQTPTLRLIINSALLCFLVQFLFNLLREFIFFPDSFSTNLFKIFMVTIISAALFTVIASSVAFNLKKVKGILQYVPIVIFILFFLLIKDYVTHFKW